eukprot:3691912-Pyramimonas_sp.AAC.1
MQLCPRAERTAEVSLESLRHFPGAGRPRPPGREPSGFFRGAPLATLRHSMRCQSGAARVHWWDF